MPQNKRGLRRPFAVEVRLDALEDELVARRAYDLSITKSECLRRGFMDQFDHPDGPNSHEILLSYRRLQRGIKGIWRDR